MSLPAALHEAFVLDILVGLSLLLVEARTSQPVCGEMCVRAKL